MRRCAPSSRRPTPDVPEHLVTDDAPPTAPCDLLQDLARGTSACAPAGGARAGGAARASTSPFSGHGEGVAFLDSDDVAKPERRSWSGSSRSPPEARPPDLHLLKVDGDFTGEDLRLHAERARGPARNGLTDKDMLVQDHIGALTAMYDRTVLGTRLMPDMPKRQGLRAVAVDRTRRARGPGAAGTAGGLPGRRAGSLSSNKLALVERQLAGVRGTNTSRCRGPRWRCPGPCGTRCASPGSEPTGDRYPWPEVS